LNNGGGCPVSRAIWNGNAASDRFSHCQMLKENVLSVVDALPRNDFCVRCEGILLIARSDVVLLVAGNLVARCEWALHKLCFVQTPDIISSQVDATTAFESSLPVCRHLRNSRSVN
jgi:hypothetical protein